MSTLLILDKYSSDEGDCLEDTFRPSLFKRIDSESSFQSLDYPQASIQDPNLSYITQPNVSKQKESPNWEFSMLYSQEHEKALILDNQLRSNTAQLEGAQRREKLISEQLTHALNKNSSFQEQFVLEIDYLKTKIKYLEQKTLDLNEKCSKLEEKNTELSKDLLAKDKKILWLENEGFIKDVKIKGLVEVESELVEMKKFKEGFEIVKEKLAICESQLNSARKDKKEMLSGLNIEVAKLNEEKIRLSKELELVSKKYERAQESVKGNNEVVKAFKDEKDELLDRVKGFEGEIGRLRVVVRAAMNMLKVSVEEEIMPKIECLLKVKNYEKLVNKISHLVLECSPTGTFSNSPSKTQIWQFIRKVLETYITLTKQNNEFTKLIHQLKSSDSQDSIKSLLLPYT